MTPNADFKCTQLLYIIIRDEFEDSMFEAKASIFEAKAKASDHNC